MDPIKQLACVISAEYCNESSGELSTGSDTGGGDMCGVSPDKPQQIIDYNNRKLFNPKVSYWVTLCSPLGTNNSFYGIWKPDINPPGCSGLWVTSDGDHQGYCIDSSQIYSIENIP